MYGISNGGGSPHANNNSQLLRKAYPKMGTQHTALATNLFSDPARLLSVRGIDPRFTVGTRIIVHTDIDLSPYTVVLRGERGTVAYVDEGTGNTDIQLDRIHPGLHTWDNCIWIIPCADTSDILNSISLCCNEEELHPCPECS
jgi:hypothetical protein